MLTINDYLKAYRSGETKPSEAVAQLYARIAAHDDKAMFITLRAMEDVVAEARVLEARGALDLPLYGIPVAVKDNIDVAGLPTTAACPDFAYAAAQDATVVARLRAAGALIIGKTNLDQFATGLVGVRSPYGVPRNTFNPEIVPGGSSSGSAVSVAAGLVPLALGTDTAGSGRVPAGLNNIVGLKPTLGALSTSGVVPACRSLDCVSIFALTVEDAYTALQVTMGFDPTDSYSRPVNLDASGVPSHLWVGVPDAASRRFGGDAASEAAFDAALADLKRLGVEIKPINMSAFFDVATLLYQGPWVAERYQGIRNFIETSASSLHPTTRAIIESASKFSAADTFAAIYKLAELRRASKSVWRDIDVLMVPTFPRPRSLRDLAADPIGPNSELGTYTNFVNLLDLCALAVPSHFRGDGLPSGVTLIGPASTDAQLATLGAKLHGASGVPLGATGKTLESSWAGPLASAGADDIELVVVGAHMSGLPLNGELSSLGARFIREAETQADYRLFALPGGPPHRPGLLRVDAGQGSAIKTEVWALSAASFGVFVSKVPSPLSIGTVRLADGTAPKGFLVEPQATIGARDISDLGGWRAFVQQAARA